MEEKKFDFALERKQQIIKEPIEILEKAFIDTLRQVYDHELPDEINMNSTELA